MFEQHPLFNVMGLLGSKKLENTHLEIRPLCSSFIEIDINTTSNVICHNICQKCPLVWGRISIYSSNGTRWIKPHREGSPTMALNYSSLQSKCQSTVPTRTANELSCDVQIFLTLLIFTHRDIYRHVWRNTTNNVDIHFQGTLNGLKFS